MNRVLLSTVMIAVHLVMFRQPAAAVSVDLRNYDPKCGVNLSQADGALTVRWPTPEGATVMTLNLSGGGALVRSIAVASGDAEPAVVLRDADPLTVLTLCVEKMQSLASQRPRSPWTCETTIRSAA